MEWEISWNYHNFSICVQSSYRKAAYKVSGPTLVTHFKQTRIFKWCVVLWIQERHTLLTNVDSLVNITWGTYMIIQEERESTLSG